MVIKQFEEISSWQKGKELTLLIYSFFENSKDYSFRDQIQRASVSIMNNIAEGFERKGNKEFKQFLFIAKGSSAEVRSMLYIAIERKFITQKQFDEAYNLSIEISKLLSGLIKTL